MIDIKRLHKVHNNYPNNARREGKTFYCFDQLLRISETEITKRQFYVADKQSVAYNSFKEFLEFLFNMNVNFKQDTKKLEAVINNCRINFISKEAKERLLGAYSTFVEDYI